MPAGRPVTSIGKYAKRIMPHLRHRDAVKKIRLAGGVEKLSKLSPEAQAVLLKVNIYRKGGSD